MQHKPSDRDPYVLKVSEAALMVKGNEFPHSSKFGEVGNRYNRPGANEEYFTIDETTGEVLLAERCSYQKRVLELLADFDQFKLKGGIGHIPLREVLTPGKDTMFEPELNMKITRITYDYSQRVRKLLYLYETLETQYETYHLEMMTPGMAKEKNKHYTPNEYLLVANDYLERHYLDDSFRNRVGEGPLTQSIEYLLSPEAREGFDDIVMYTNLYLKAYMIANNIDTQPQDYTGSETYFQAVLKALREFRYIEELLKEFQTRADIRFSDTLCQACSIVAQEWNTQEEIYS